MTDTAVSDTAETADPQARPDVRLVLADMDGTLLGADGEVPEDLWPLIDRMHEAGVVFAPASGRQYATLAHMFARTHAGMVFIAENGGYVVRDDVEISSTALPREAVAGVVAAMRGLSGDGADLGVVVCGKRSAYVERTDHAFLQHVAPYYLALTEVNDLDAVNDDDIVKVAVFSFDPPDQVVVPALAPFKDGQQVVVSGAHWVDVMPDGVHKGLAVRRLQESLGITAEQTVAFGDYLNDLEMLDAAHLSFAMANAHPEVLDRANHQAPSNLDNGVVTTLTRLLDESGVPRL